MVKYAAGPRDYKWEWTWTATETGDYYCSATGEAKWNLPSVPFRFNIQTTDNVVPYYQANIASPWYTGLLDSGASFLASATFSVEFDDIQIVGPCTAPVCSFSEMRIYWNGVLKHTTGAQSFACGTAPSGHYAAGSNATEVTVDMIAETSPKYGVLNWQVDPDGVTCGLYANRANWTTISICEAKINGGWSWNDGSGWHTDTVEVLPIEIGSSSLCPCSYTSVSASSAGGGTSGASNALETLSTWHYSTNVATFSDVACPCPSDGHDRYYYHWQITLNQAIIRNAKTTFVDVNSRLLEHRVIVNGPALCKSYPPLVGSTLNSDITYTDSVAESIQALVFKGGTAVKDCYQFKPFQAACLDTGGGDGDPPAVCPVDNSTWCLKSGLVTSTWTIDPTCIDPPTTGCGPWNLTWDTNESAMCWVASGDIQWRYSNAPCPNRGDIVTSVVSIGDAVCARFMRDDKILRIWMIFERSSLGIWECFSDDHGRHWSTPALVDSNGMGPFNSASSKNELAKFWAVYVSGTSGPQTVTAQTRDTGGLTWSSSFTFKYEDGTDVHVKDGQCSNLNIAYDNPYRALWTPILDGNTTPSVLISTNNLRNWKVLT